MANARKIAVNALIQIEENNGYSNIVLNSVFSKYTDLAPYDKSLISLLFYGVLERKITIDYILSKHIKKPLSKILPITLQALRIAVYQMAFMDKIPVSAAVNESVNIVKSTKERFNSGFVNGVLRSIIREGIDLPSDNKPESLAVRFSCPKEIVESFIADYGIENTVKLLEHSLLKPPIILRINTLKISAEDLIYLLDNEGISSERIADNALIVKDSIDVQNSACYKKGLFYVQDLASQRAVEVLAPKPFERVMDMCAAPGGKSFTMAQLMENKGQLLSFDLYPQRAKIIADGAKRLGIDIIIAATGDAMLFNEELGEFDSVLCDVPCSGWGVIRRKPEIKYKNEDYSSLFDIQLSILKNAARYVKPKGRLLYSTCTLRKAENELIIKAFLDKHPTFEVKYQHTYMPHIDGTDGFFCALLVKSR